MKSITRKTYIVFYFLIFSMTIFGINNVKAALLTADQSYENGASSSIVMEVELTDVDGTLTLMTVGSGIDSPDSFISGTFVSESGFIYSFDESAIIDIIDAYVNTPFSDLGGSGIATGIVWYHFTLDTAILSANCYTSECFFETPSEFSEYAIWQPSFFLNTGPVSISLTSVPLPSTFILFVSGLLSLFWSKKWA